MCQPGCCCGCAMLMQSQDRIPELKAALPDILSCTALQKESDTSYSGPCPVCGGSDRFVFKTDTGRCWCRGCHGQAMDVIDFHCWESGKTIQELIREYLTDDAGQDKDTRQPTPHDLFSKRGLTGEVIRVLTETRGIKVTAHDGKQCVAVPYVTLDGETKATQYLTIDQGPFPFTQKEGRRPANKVFGKGDKPGDDCFFLAGPGPDQADKIIITEGVINALTAWQWFPKACCIALGGSTYTRKVKALKPYIRQTAKVIICQDNDDAGKRMVQSIHQVLGNKVHRLVWGPDDEPGLDLNDLLQAGQTERGQAMIQMAPEATQPGNDDPIPLPESLRPQTWEAHIPLDENQPPAMDPNILPGIVGDMVRAVSIETETPLELATGIGLSVIATACQGKIIIEIKPGYREPLNLWVIVALDPANRKTSVLSRMTAPLTAWEREQHKQMEPRIKEAASRRQNQESRIKSLRTKYGKAKPDELREIEAEILEIENDLEEIPTLPKAWAQDVTPEHLGTLMAQHDERMSIISAEGGIFDIAAGRYSNGVPNLDLFLQGHAGDSVRVDRGSREPVYMDSPAITFGLSPQPGVLKGLADQPGFRSRGFLARYLYFLPGSKLGYRALDTTPVPVSIKNNYYHLVYQLLNLKPGEDEHGDVKPHVLTLSKDAYQEWADFYMAVEKDLRDDGRFEHIRDWAGKLPGAATRIAGLLHCADNPNDPWNIPVSLETMTRALDLAAVFADHALITFDLMGADTSLDGARKVWRWVERNRLESFSKRDCHNALQGSFKRVKELEEPLIVLIERNYIQAETKQTGGRPSIIYRVNPEIIKGRP